MIRRRDRGASVVELALVTPVLALVVLGTLDLTSCYRMQIRLENAAREGGAYAQVFPGHVTCVDDDDIVDRVLDEDLDVVTFADLEVRVLREDATGEPTLSVTGCGQTEVSPGSRVRVDVTANHAIVTPFVQRAVGTHVVVTGSYEVVVHG